MSGIPLWALINQAVHVPLIFWILGDQLGTRTRWINLPMGQSVKVVKQGRRLRREGGEEAEEGTHGSVHGDLDQFYAWNPGEARFGTARSCEHVRTHPVSTAEEKRGEGSWQQLEKQRTPAPTLTQKSRLKANMRYLTPWRQPRAMLQRFSSRRKMKERSR